MLQAVWWDLHLSWAINTACCYWRWTARRLSVCCLPQKSEVEIDMCPVAKCCVIHFMMFDLPRLIGLCSVEYQINTTSVSTNAQLCVCWFCLFYCAYVSIDIDTEYWSFHNMFKFIQQVVFWIWYHQDSLWPNSVFSFTYLTLVANKFSLKSVLSLPTAALIWIVGQFEPVVEKLFDQVWGSGIIYFKAFAQPGKTV